MGYDAANEKMRDYRKKHISALMGEGASKWFTSLWGSVSDMLSTFKSDSENSEIAANYATAKHREKMAAHVKLDCVCALRREVRKQYVSREGDIYTDVTPFRYGCTSVSGAMLFANTLDSVMKKSEQA